jgi:hypothetical protein
MTTRPDSIDALRRLLERKRERLAAAFDALEKVEAGRRRKTEASYTSAHLVAVLLRLIDAEDPLTPGEDRDPMETGGWLARLPIVGKAKVQKYEAPEPRAGWYLNPEVKGCPPLCVTEVSLRTVDFFLEGEREEAAVTVARATFDELLRAGYEPAA